MPSRSPVASLQHSSPINYRDSFNPFSSSSSGKTSSTSLPTTDDSLSDSTPVPHSYINHSSRLASGKPYKIPKRFYPVRMNHKLRDIEMWENTFIQHNLARPTITPTEQIPPKPVILDLACGNGAWSILAARYFKESHIIGFDLQNIQPNLKDLDCDIVANKLEWIHGDMLTRLPFPDDYFDVVKSQYIELCVPSFKWEDLLKEIDRVLKPNGIIEFSLQMPTFPCPRFPPRSRNNPKRSCEDLIPGISLQLQDHDPRDHSLLKDAFDAMLDVRHLNVSSLTSLPEIFKSLFENVSISPICHAMLPPSSVVREISDDVFGNAVEPTCLEDKSFDFAGLFSQTTEELVVDYGGCLPLNATINLVLACKDALWEQFEVIYQSLKRNDFDYLMNNWEYDMRDRMNMGSVIKEYLGWECNGDAEPERKFWRSELRKYHEADGIWDALSLPQACRSVRIFLASKR